MIWWNQELSRLLTSLEMSRVGSSHELAFKRTDQKFKWQNKIVTTMNKSFLTYFKRMLNTIYGLEWYTSSSDLKKSLLFIKGSAENIGQINCKFNIVRIGIFLRFLHQWTENIPNIVWVCNKAFWIENYGSQALLNSILEFSGGPNFENFSESWYVIQDMGIQLLIILHLGSF